MEAQIRRSVIGILCTCNGAPDEPQWVFERVSDGWTIKNQESGKYVGVENYSDNDGSKVISVEIQYTWDIWPENENEDEDENSDHFR